MNTRPSPKPQHTELLKEATKLLNELAHSSFGGGYIYRGETRFGNSHVSSSLYRHIVSQYPGTAGAWHNIELVQDEFLEEAKKFTTETDRNEILATLRHNGGVVNVVDFTTDYNIALFFACDGSTTDINKDGRIIILEKEKFETVEPVSPLNRVIAQKSIFVVPPSGGLIDSSDIEAIVRIPAYLKQTILKYLEASHHIRAESVYNDLIGFIQLQDRYTSPIAQAIAALTSADRGDLRVAVERYSKMIGVAPWDMVALYYRGQCHFELGEFSRSIADFTRAIEHPDTLPRLWNGLAYNFRGAAQLRMGNLVQAADDLSQARDLTPKDLSASVDVNHGMLSLAQSDWPAAESALRCAMHKGDFEGFGFFEAYGSIERFNHRYGVILPDHIIELLRSPEGSRSPSGSK